MSTTRGSATFARSIDGENYVLTSGHQMTFGFADTAKRKERGVRPNSNRAIRRILGAVLALATASAVASPAGAANASPASPKTPKGWIVVEQHDGGRVLKADPRFRGHVTSLMADNPRASSGEMRAADLCSGFCELSSYDYRDIDPSGAPIGFIQASASSYGYLSNCSGLCAPCKVEYSSNNSQVYYFDDNSIGNDPDSVTQTDVWDTDYLGVSIPISYPPGGSVSPGSGKLEWSTTVDDTWQSFHDWEQVIMDTGCGYSRITGLNFGTTGAFQWGSQFFAITTTYGTAVA